MAMTPELRSVLDELKGRLEGLYGARLARLVLYGSQARGDAGPHSDIDLLIVLREPVRPGEEIARTSRDVAEISLAHDAVIMSVFVSESDYLQRQGPFLRNVRREGIVL